VTVDAIAARARASKTTMYRRWQGKAELVADALRRQALGAAPEVPDTGSLRGDLLATVGQIARTLSGDAGPSLIGMVEAIRDDAVLREVIGSQVRQRGREVGEIICARAEARGDDVRTERSAAVLDLAFAQLMTNTLFGGGAPPPEALEELVDDVLLPLLSRVPDRA
jgi:AcrR family transcriptional regulator